MLSSEDKNKTVKILYFVSFFTSFHYALVAYINSSYLANFIAEGKIGFLYSLGSILTILTIPNLSKVLKKIGQFKTVLSALFINLISILTLAATASPALKVATSFPLTDGNVFVDNFNSLTPWVPLLAIGSFLMFQISLVLNYILLDIYLKEFSKKSETGSDRGWFLLAINSAFVLSPFLVGMIITGQDDGFWKIYLISSLFIFLALTVVFSKLRDVKDIEYHNPPFLQTAKKVANNKNILSIYLSSFLLSFFYSWMVIYTPIYLHENIGFDWSEIGTIFSIMLTAFVILQLPLGKIADKYLGEKEILTIGFLIMAISTGLLSFIDSKSLITWSIALFMTRVGASAIEIMNDTYFFKKVKAEDTDIISFYRNANPVAYIVGPTLASLILYFIDYKYLFLVLGAITLSGTIFSLRIKDTL
jgi:MFS family permease